MHDSDLESECQARQRLRFTIESDQGDPRGAEICQTGGLIVQRKKQDLPSKN